MTKAAQRYGLLGLKVPEGSWQEAERSRLESQAGSRESNLERICLPTQTSPLEAASPSGFKLLRLWGSLVTKPPQSPLAGKCPEQIKPQCRRQEGAIRWGRGHGTTRLQGVSFQDNENILEPDSGSAMKLKI